MSAPGRRVLTALLVKRGRWVEGDELAQATDGNHRLMKEGLAWVDSSWLVERRPRGFDMEYRITGRRGPEVRGDGRKNRCDRCNKQLNKRAYVARMQVRGMDVGVCMTCERVLKMSGWERA